MLWLSTAGFWNVLSLFLLLSLRYAVAVKKNRTVDDALGNSVTGPIFFPPGEAWQHQDCLGCPFQLDRARTFNKTWSVGSVVQGGTISVAMSFKGTAIYIFFITPNQIQDGNFTTLMECDFVVDGQQKSRFQHVPDGSQGIQYNVLAFSMTDLPNVDHSVRFTTPIVDHSLLLVFDYAIYTFDDDNDPTSFVFPSPPRSSSSVATAQPSLLPHSERKPPIGTIIGGAVGGLAALLGMIFLLCIYRDKKDKQKRSGSRIGMDPLTHHNSAPTNGLGSNSSLLAFRSRRSIVHGVSGRFEKPPLHPPTNTDFVSHAPPTGYAVFPSTKRQPVAPAVVDDAFHARRMDLERQLHAVEEELREIGPEPIPGPSDINVTPMALRTSMYTDYYQHSQRGTEEPLPEYSDRGNQFSGS